MQAGLGTDLIAQAGAVHDDLGLEVLIDQGLADGFAGVLGDLVQQCDARSVVVDVRGEDSDGDDQAEITGSINDLCPSDRSLGYGLRPRIPPPQQTMGCGPADFSRTHTMRQRQSLSKNHEPPFKVLARFP
ncbi:hypothetical protein ACIRQP_35460 [Streptomyces sp. NPDC102274]|uniref:hypothetical protein n=1 Tax=Streptomyces sp. NPDC102274 TaxID=3366151 RepID=UPI0037FB4F79